MALLEEMGIKIMSLEDGRMQLLHALATVSFLFETNEYSQDQKFRALRKVKGYP